MAMVLYSWSLKGEPDLCKREDVPSMKVDHLCYHCGKLVPAGSPVALLLTDRGENFILHKACADASTKALRPE